MLERTAASRQPGTSRVLVSGCFDLLHAGHLRFFETAAAYGELHVCVGSDENIVELKGRAPQYSEDERTYLVGSLASVAHARVSSGRGVLDFEADLVELQPDVFVVNDPGVNRLDFDGEHWPTKVWSDTTAETAEWLSQHLVLVPLWERPDGYDPLVDQNIETSAVRRLGESGEACWNAIVDHDLAAFGNALTATHDAWREILPLTTSPQIDAALDRLGVLGTGRGTTGAGGGYAMIATARSPGEIAPNAFRVAVI